MLFDVVCGIVFSVFFGHRYLFVDPSSAKLFYATFAGVIMMDVTTITHPTRGDPLHDFARYFSSGFNSDFDSRKIVELLLRSGTTWRHHRFKGGINVVNELIVFFFDFFKVVILSGLLRLSFLLIGAEEVHHETFSFSENMSVMCGFS